MLQSSKRWKEAPENISDFFLGFFFQYLQESCVALYMCVHGFLRLE